MVAPSKDRPEIISVQMEDLLCIEDAKR